MILSHGDRGQHENEGSEKRLGGISKKRERKREGAQRYLGQTTPAGVVQLSGVSLVSLNSHLPVWRGNRITRASSHPRTMDPDLPEFTGARRAARQLTQRQLPLTIQMIMGRATTTDGAPDRFTATRTSRQVTRRQPMLTFWRFMETRTARQDTQPRVDTQGRFTTTQQIRYNQQ